MRYVGLFVGLCLVLTTGAFAAEETEKTDTNLLDAITKGTFKLNLRYRYEDVDQDGFDKRGQASTLRTMAGYKTGTVLEFPSEGHQTVHRTVSNLYFKITELPHPKYQLNGDNLIYTHDLSLADPLDCRPVDLMTLDARALTIGLDSIAWYPPPNPAPRR